MGGRWGQSIGEIVRKLNHAGILTPSHHWLQVGVIQNAKMAGGKYWQTRTVRRILTNEIYTGTMVRGKTQVTRHKQISVPCDEWLRIVDTHPAIIRKELYAAVQESLFNAVNGIRQQYEQYTPNLFKGKIFCGHCGRRLDRKRSHQHYVYCCTAKYTAPGSCPGNNIREETLIERVSQVLLEFAENLANVPTDFGDEKSIETELAEMQIESFYNGDMLKNLYEALAMGKITEREYRDIKTQYGREKNSSQNRWIRLSVQKMEQAAKAAEIQELRADLEKYQDTRFLTRELIDKMIERIEVQGSDLVYVKLRV